MSDRQAIYDQDCEFMRYHDGLIWGRVQTISALEAGMMYVAFGFPSITTRDAGFLLAVGLVFAVLLTLQVRNDRKTFLEHQDRVKLFEGRVAPYVKRTASMPF